LSHLKYTSLTKKKKVECLKDRKKWAKLLGKRVRLEEVELIEEGCVPITNLWALGPI
jgi:hypothetical protein